MAETSQGHLLAVAVGNTRTRFGVFHGDELSDQQSLPNADVAALVQAVLKAAEGEHGVSIVIADVNPKVADQLQKALEDAGEENVFRIGRDIEIPMTHSLEDGSTLGQDRLLCAFGAFARAKQACVVVDAGTAVTVDFVDGEGVFHGGVIAPGLNMMLQAMHEKTAKLPALAYQTPERGGALQIGDAKRPQGEVVDEGPAQPSVPNPFGKDTKNAMLLGVTNSVIGLVRYTAEQYAEFFGAYPQVVATGGDAPALFGQEATEGGGVVESIVPDLQLIGILEVCRAVEEMRASGME
ncbi:MAG TPA: type III pantothenate kinase [Phycisphaerales bacterium]|nr:type III pantothenate kinase [Phycisphaerales bacterium]